MVNEKMVDAKTRAAAEFYNEVGDQAYQQIKDHAKNGIMTIHKAGWDAAMKEAIKMVDEIELDIPISKDKQSIYSRVLDSFEELKKRLGLGK